MESTRIRLVVEKDGEIKVTGLPFCLVYHLPWENVA